MPALSTAGRRLLAALAADPAIQLRRTAGARPRFYLLNPGQSGRRTLPVNQQTGQALHRGGFIAEVEQTGQHLPHGVDRASAPFLWGLTGKAHEALAASPAT